jgi:hypothetical protein
MTVPVRALVLDPVPNQELQVQLIGCVITSGADSPPRWVMPLGEQASATEEEDPDPDPVSEADRDQSGTSIKGIFTFPTVWDPSTEGQRKTEK